MLQKQEIGANVMFWQGPPCDVWKIEWERDGQINGPSRRKQCWQRGHGLQNMTDEPRVMTGQSWAPLEPCQCVPEQGMKDIVPCNELAIHVSFAHMRARIGSSQKWNISFF